MSITTEPVGVPLLQACSLVSSNDKVPSPWVQTVLSDVSRALEFMHKSSIYHRDVNPKNVIVVTTKTGPQAILIDYGIAFKVQYTGGGSKGEASRSSGFFGTVNYAHRKLFEYYPGRAYDPEAKHDWAGLGLTMAVLVNGCKLPWNPIVDFHVTIKDPKDEKISLLREVMDERYNSAYEAVLHMDGVAGSKQEENWRKVRNEILGLLDKDKT